MKDYTVKKYPEFVNTEHINANRKTIGDVNFRFSLTIPFRGMEGNKFLRVIMKNPSTADSTRCDRTALNVCNNAYYAGYGGVIIINLFPIMATHSGEVYTKFYKNHDLFEETMGINFEIIDDVCDESDVVFAWGTNTIRQNKEFQKIYDDTIEHVINIVTKGCAKFATALYPSNGKYPDHPCRAWSSKDLLKESLKATEVEEVFKTEKKPTPNDEEYWKSKYLDRLILHETGDHHPVLHHNLFGTSADYSEIKNEDDFKIYCRKEHDICIPNCNGCPMWRGDEMGHGRTCLWDDFHDGDERVIPNDKKEKEFARIDSDLNGPDDLELSRNVQSINSPKLMQG